jgi:hypothetical protein
MRWYAVARRVTRLQTSPLRPLPAYHARVLSFAEMASHRIARGRQRADEILAFNSARRYAIDVLVNPAKLRWRIERDYAELKRELGLAHFEGRSAARLP